MYTKSFNTLTSRFQAEAAERDGDAKIVQWIAGDDPEEGSAVVRGEQGVDYVRNGMAGLLQAPRELAPA